jgi:AcrR family transcriptional regulator
MVGVRQFDESQALNKALALFWQKGFSQTTMQDLADATGVQRGSLYNAYGDKETLFLRVFGVYRQTYVTKMRQAMDKPELSEALRSFFDFVIASMRTGTPTRGCLSTKTAVGVEALDEAVSLAIRDLLDEIEAALCERLSRPGQAEQLALAPPDAAKLIVTHTRGLVVIERVYRDEKRMRLMARLLIRLLVNPSS